MIKAAAIDRLKQEGLRRGGLTLEDIQRFLPLDAVTTDELAAVLMQLEDAGIAVELDDALLADRGLATNVHELRPEPAAASDSGRVTGSQREWPRAGPVPGTRLEAAGRPERPTRKSVPVFAVALVVVAAVILLFLVLNL